MCSSMKLAAMLLACPAMAMKVGPIIGLGVGTAAIGGVIALSVLNHPTTTLPAPAQPHTTQTAAPFEKEAHWRDLAKDNMFEMTWAPKTNAPIRVGADDQCKSWKADGQFSCFIEGPEHELVDKWIPTNATVMEFGARFGTTTCEISKKLQNSGRFVAVEPDDQVWGFLEENIKSHNCHARVLRGALSSKPLQMLGSGYGGRSSLRGQEGSYTVPTYTFDEIEKASGLKFDTLLIDCEGCAQHMMDQLGPKIETQIKLVLIEADMPDDGGDCTSDCMHYPKFFDFLAKNGFQQIDEFNDCDHSRSHAPQDTWCGPWIKHYAFRKTS